MDKRGAPHGIPELRNRKLKEAALAFYAEHNVTGAIEKLLNEMYLASPTDVYGYMSEYFGGLSKEPTIAKLTASQALDDRGHWALEVNVFCTVAGVEKPHCTTGDLHTLLVSVSLQEKNGICMPLQGVAEKEQDHTYESTDEYQDPFKTINVVISSVLSGQKVCDQQAIDRILKSVQGGRLHTSVQTAVSFAVAKAAAFLKRAPLHQHFAAMIADQEQSFALPVPVISALASGQIGNGKLRILEFCLVASPEVTFVEQVANLTSVYHQIGELLASKAGPIGQAAIPHIGYCPLLDRVEQAFEILKESVGRTGLELTTHVTVLLDVGAYKVFDKEKSKYEIIAGQWKSTDDMVKFYCDILDTYPGVLGFVDPLHPDDVPGWVNLYQQLGHRCLLISDNTLSELPVKTESAVASSKEGGSTVEQNKPDVCDKDVPPSPGLSYLSCAATTARSTVSTAFESVGKLKESSHYVMLKTPPTLTNDSVLADLAVAMRCRFLRLGAPTGVASCSIISRLLAIKEELESEHKCQPAKAHLYICEPS